MVIPIPFVGLRTRISGAPLKILRQMKEWQCHLSLCQWGHGFFMNVEPLIQILGIIQPVYFAVPNILLDKEGFFEVANRLG